MLCVCVCDSLADSHNYLPGDKSNDVIFPWSVISPTLDWFSDLWKIGNFASHEKQEKNCQALLLVPGGGCK